MVSKYWDESAELDKLAELSIKTGVALQSGQDLLITAPFRSCSLGSALGISCLQTRLRNSDTFIHRPRGDTSTLSKRS